MLAYESEWMCWLMNQSDTYNDMLAYEEMDQSLINQNE